MAQQLGEASDVDCKTTECPRHTLSQHSHGVPTEIRVLIVYLFGFCLPLSFFIPKDLRLRAGEI